MSDKVSLAELMRETMAFLDHIEKKQRIGHGVLKEEEKPNGERVLRVNLPVKYERRP